HLSSGLWILQNHALPHNGIYSQAGAAPWTPVSWGYDVLLAALYRGMDLRAIPALLMCLRTALAVVTFFLAGGARGRFWSAVILSTIAQYVLGGIPPSPAYFSIVFFAVELFLIFETRERPRAIFWLAPLFLAWANLDDEFVYGIGLLLLFLAISAIEGVVARRRTFSAFSGVHLSRLVAASVATIIASLITPSFYHPYTVFFHSVAGTATTYLPDFKAMSFHQPHDYLLLLLTMGAFLALGRRRSRDAFQIALLCVAAMLSFYAQRNVWMVALTAVAIIGDAALPAPRVPSQVSGFRPRVASRFITAGVASCGLLVIIVWGIPRSRDSLLAKVAETYPVAASNYIREHSLPQPLFNAYEWGGFLTWYLPQYPVAIDSRTDLYGDDFIILYSKTMNADVAFTAFPAMASARTLVFAKTSVLGEALTNVAGFKVAYSDDVGLVLIRDEDPVAAK
ncbi:MAG TPA: hypothetical protein VMT53_11415, partial [Terriglobales bacterium]|nr:hypothetical protein [Terriglobales bacterium]